MGWLFIKVLKFYVRRTKDTENCPFLKMWTHAFHKPHTVILGGYIYLSKNILKEF